ncbi:UNVERIFIED_CONTAM: hypothetical protein Scaly_2195600 [Sesamum calycinum]|uniref:Uncharacterized protein n=1 Tax=Sesamum calycinum TaxID=2727403 RepID=A0AAW2MPD2_9LAMI
MFATAIRYIAKKPKPKMKPIELKTPPEQTQTITRVIFDVLKEHGPLTVADTWSMLSCSFDDIQMYLGNWVYYEPIVIQPAPALSFIVTLHKIIVIDSSWSSFVICFLAFGSPLLGTGRSFLELSGDNNPCSINLQNFKVEMPTLLYLRSS